MKKLAFLSAGILAFALQNASAQTTLFTTVDDFIGAYANSANETVSIIPWSVNPSTVNGAGNIDVGPGGAGTPGSLEITFVNQPNADYTPAWIPNNAWDQTFISAIDPGGIAAWQPPSYPNGSLATYSGIMTMDYSLPDNEGGSYFQVGLDLAYPDDGYFSNFMPSSTTDLGVTWNGEEMYQATIPYSIVGGSEDYTGMGFAIIVNSDYGSVLPFVVDNIQVQPVPEPSTMALVGMGTLGFAFLARRRRA